MIERSPNCHVKISKGIKLNKEGELLCMFFIRVLNSHLHTSDSGTVTASAAAHSMLYLSQMFLVLVKKENGKTICV